MQEIRCSPDIVGHLWRNCTPDACSVMMYSLPMALEGLSLQSRIFGVGTVVLDCTGIRVRPQSLSFPCKGFRLTVFDSGHLGVSGQSSWSCNRCGQPRHSTLRIVAGENKNPVETPVGFLVFGNGNGARANVDNSLAKRDEIEI